MKNYSIFLLALFSAASVFFMITGCGSSTTDAEASIDLKKVSDGKIPIQDVYDKIELIPLDRGPVGLPLSDLSVTEDRFFLKGGDRMILSYRQDGSLADSLNPGKPIVDYSIYKDKILDILFPAEMCAYHLPDLLLPERRILDTLVTPTKLARKAERVMLLTGYKRNKDYLCEYYFDTKRYFASPGFYEFEQTGQARTFTQRMRFLHSNDTLLLLDPASGWLWECGEFTFGFLWLDFKRREGDTLTVTNAQVTDQYVYYSLLLNDEEHFLFYERATRKGRLIKTTREGLSLSLGVIRNGANYFFCPAALISRYVSRDLLDQKNISILDTAVGEGKDVILKCDLARRQTKATLDSLEISK